MNLRLLPVTMNPKARIGFSTSLKPNIISRTISWFLKSKVSHTYFVFWDVVLGMEVVMESAWMGYRITPYDLWQLDNQVVEEYEGFPYVDKIVQLAAEELAEAYNYGKLFGMIFVVAGKWFKRKWHNPFHDAKSGFCSEITTRAMKKMGIIDSSIVPEDTSPEDLRIIVKNLEIDGKYVFTRY